MDQLPEMVAICLLIWTSPLLLFERIPRVGGQLPTAYGSSDEPWLMRSEESPETPY